MRAQWGGQVRNCLQRPDRFQKPVRSASDDSREYLVAAACSGQYDEEKNGWGGGGTVGRPAIAGVVARHKHLATAGGSKTGTTKSIRIRQSDYS